MTAVKQTDQALGPGAEPGPSGVGAQLRAARERAGLTLEQVAQETRISKRHLENIELGRFAELPARTYAMGFSRSFAKAVGLDQDDVAALVVRELDAQQPRTVPRQPSFEPGDPARVPSARLWVFSLVAVVVLLVGLFFVMRQMFAPAAELPSLVVQEQQAERAAQAQARATARRGQQPPAAATPAGPVVFTALEEGVWVRFYDADGMQLLQKFMAEGESYTVPTEARGPMLWTGRPDALAITVGGRGIPPLAEDGTILRDVPVNAQALLARGDVPEDEASPPAT